MASYTVHNRTVQVYARFANENERNLQPQQEALMEIYRQCGEVYNEQEKKKEGEGTWRRIFEEGKDIAKETSQQHSTLRTIWKQCWQRMGLR